MLGAESVRLEGQERQRCALAIALLAAAWRVLQARLVVDSGGLTDYRAVCTVRVRWEDVAGFEVIRPAGPWGGFCVRVIQTAGKPADLLATRGLLAAAVAVGLRRGAPDDVDACRTVTWRPRMRPCFRP